MQTCITTTWNHSLFSWFSLQEKMDTLPPAVVFWAHLNYMEAMELIENDIFAQFKVYA